MKEKGKIVILITLVVIGSYVVAKNYYAYNRNYENVGTPAVNRQSVNDDVPNRPLLRKEYDFQFTVADIKDGIFIEASEERYDYEINRTFRAKGFQIPEGRKRMKVDPNMLAGLFLNNVNDAYTIFLKNARITAKTEGFYYNFDEGCGDDTITVKLSPGTPVDAEASGSPMIILKHPHPQVEKISITEYTKTHIPADLASVLMKLLAEKFAFFVKTSYQTIFSGPPQVELYVPKDRMRYQMLSASWRSDLGEMQCCIAGVFQVIDDDGKIELKEVIPLDSPDSIGVAGIAVKYLVQLNERKFVFVEKGYWEWRNSEVYEVIHGTSVWQSYKQARGGGGC